MALDEVTLEALLPCGYYSQLPIEVQSVGHVHEHVELLRDPPFADVVPGARGGWQEWRGASSTVGCIAAASGH